MNVTSCYVKYKSSPRPPEIIFLAKLPAPVLGMNFNCVSRVSECYVSKWWSVYFMPHLQAVFSSKVPLSFILRILRCSVHFIFVNVLYSNLSQCTICSYLISLESFKVMLSLQGLTGKKKKSSKIHSWQKHIFFFSFFNMLAPMKIMPCLLMNQKKTSHSLALLFV